MNRNEFVQGLASASPILLADDIDERVEKLRKIKSGRLDNDTRLKIIAVQECSELIKEVTDDIRDKGDKMGILEEMADVLICINTLQAIYGITDEDLSKAMNVKLVELDRKFIDTGEIV